MRVIVIDSMHDKEVSGAQVTWFANTLESARQAGLSVLCISHYIPYYGGDKIACNFTNIDFTYGLGMRAYTEAVDAFKADGGSFVAWLVGHAHCDFVMKIGTNKDQLAFATAMAGNNNRSGDMQSTDDSRSQDCVNFISIDLVSELLRIHRIGRNLSRYGQVRNNISIKYSTCTIMAQS